MRGANQKNDVSLAYARAREIFEKSVVRLRNEERAIAVMRIICKALPSYTSFEGQSEFAFRQKNLQLRRKIIYFKRIQIKICRNLSKNVDS